MKPTLIEYKSQHSHSIHGTWIDGCGRSVEQHPRGHIPMGPAVRRTEYSNGNNQEETASRQDRNGDGDGTQRFDELGPDGRGRRAPVVEKASGRGQSPNGRMCNDNYDAWALIVVVVVQQNCLPAGSTWHPLCSLRRFYPLRVRGINQSMHPKQDCAGVPTVDRRSSPKADSRG